MDPHMDHLINCARSAIATVIRGTTDVYGVPDSTAWAAFDCHVFVDDASKLHICGYEAALMVIWLLAKKQYTTPAELESEMGVLLAPVILGEVA